MKKLVPLFLLALLVAFTVPALAGNGDLEWAATKTIKLTETFNYSEKVDFTGTGLFLFDGEAWAKIQEQQELYSLNLEVDAVTRKQANITSGAFNDATGIANVNQSPGNMNNQANEVAFAHANNGTDAPAETNTFQGMYCEAQVVSVQYNGILFTPKNPGADANPALGGTRTPAANTLLTSNSTLSDRIANSFNGFAGIANVNQSAGYVNNQGNAVALAGGVSADGTAQVVVKAASDVMLAQASAFNNLADGNKPGETGFPGNNNSDAIGNSFGGAFGVANVNQAAGFLNNQKNAVAISFAGQTPK